MEILVGYTGFVGGNIAACHSFDMLCNSKNIADAFGKSPDLLVYSGVPAEMYLANNDPQADRAICENAAENIRRINPERVVLISTIVVLDNPIGADEDAEINESKLTDYGSNRLHLERLVAGSVEHCHIVRLPALFGNGIKKNFIYDMIHYLPALLNEAKLAQLSAKEPFIAENYTNQGNGFYKLNVSDENRAKLKAMFERTGFSALNFTDSRSRFQFYNLAHLWGHIITAIENELPLFHTAAEPLSAGEVFEYIYGKPFANELPKPPFNYNYHTKYAGLFGGDGEYIFGREETLGAIKGFVEMNK